MRVIHFIDTLEGGGAELVLINVLSGLRDAGWESAVVSLHNRSKLLPEVQSLVSNALIASDGLYSFLQPWSRKQRQEHHRLFSFVRDFEPNIIHANLGASYLAAYKINKRFDIPYVLTVHGVGRWWPEPKPVLSGISQSLSSYLTRVYMKRSFFNAKTILAVSKGVENSIRRRLPNLTNVTLLENCIDPKFLEPCLSPLPKFFDVIMCGRLVEDKNPLFALRALRLVRDSYCNLKAVWVGDGPMRNEFLQEVQRLEMSNNIHLAGWVSQSEVMHLLDQSSCLFLPSKSEAFALSAIEALCRGLCVVMSDIPSLAATYHDVAGVRFFDSLDEREAALEILMTLRTGGLKPDINGLLDRFGRQRYIDKLALVYSGSLHT